MRCDEALAAGAGAHERECSTAPERRRRVRRHASWTVGRGLCTPARQRVEWSPDGHRPTATNGATRAPGARSSRTCAASWQPRDEHGVVGSINWLRAHMERRGANPNVVRNIIYRDKGKLPDKRVLFEILDDLWRSSGQAPLLHVPELEVMLAPGSGNDQEVLQLLGREKRRAYRTLRPGRALRSGAVPKMIVTGRPGSGKTLLSRLRAAGARDRAAGRRPHRPARVHRHRPRHGARAPRRGGRRRSADGVDAREDRLVERLRRPGRRAGRRRSHRPRCRARASRVAGPAPPRLAVAGRPGRAGLDRAAPQQPDVPRVSASEWLWLSLVEPLSRLPSTALLVSMTTSRCGPRSAWGVRGPGQADAADRERGAAVRARQAAQRAGEPARGDRPARRALLRGAAHPHAAGRDPRPHLRACATT
jgi:hypothetical protein